MIKAPIKLKMWYSIIGTWDVLNHKIRGNYQLLPMHISAEDLIHMVTMPAEMLAERDGAEVAIRNYIQLSHDMKIDILNQIINRLLLFYEGQHSTYQDEVYLACTLRRLGITDTSGFMQQLNKVIRVNGQIVRLKELYQANAAHIRTFNTQSAPSAFGVPGTISAPPIHIDLRAEIFNRLKTASICQMMNNHYQYERVLGQEISEQEFALTEYQKQADSIQLRNFKTECMSTNIPVGYRELVNPYEKREISGKTPNEEGGNAGEMSETVILADLAAAILVNLTERAYYYTSVGSNANQGQRTSGFLLMHKVISKSGINTVERFITYHLDTTEHSMLDKISLEYMHNVNRQEIKTLTTLGKQYPQISQVDLQYLWERSLDWQISGINGYDIKKISIALQYIQEYLQEKEEQIQSLFQGQHHFVEDEKQQDEKHQDGKQQDEKRQSEKLQGEKKQNTKYQIEISLKFLECYAKAEGQEIKTDIQYLEEYPVVEGAKEHSEDYLQAHTGLEQGIRFLRQYIGREAEDKTVQEAVIVRENNIGWRFLQRYTQEKMQAIRAGLRFLQGRVTAEKQDNQVSIQYLQECAEDIYAEDKGAQIFAGLRYLENEIQNGVQGLQKKASEGSQEVATFLHCLQLYVVGKRREMQSEIINLPMRERIKGWETQSVLEYRNEYSAEKQQNLQTSLQLIKQYIKLEKTDRQSTLSAQSELRKKEQQKLTASLLYLQQETTKILEIIADAHSDFQDVKEDTYGMTSALRYHLNQNQDDSTVDYQTTAVHETGGREIKEMDKTAAYVRSNHNILTDRISNQTAWMSHWFAQLRRNIACRSQSAATSFPRCLSDISANMDVNANTDVNVNTDVNTDTEQVPYSKEELDKINAINLSIAEKSQFKNTDTKNGTNLVFDKARIRKEWLKQITTSQPFIPQDNILQENLQLVRSEHLSGASDITSFEEALQNHVVKEYSRPLLLERQTYAELVHRQTNSETIMETKLNAKLKTLNPEETKSLKIRSDQWITNTPTRDTLSQTQITKLKKEVVETTAKELNTLIWQQVHGNMNAITDKVYSKLEKRLQNERKRRGY